MHILTMLALLSILILVHELGHFCVARKLGIKVERFGFGMPFGATFFETKWGDTKICFHYFLLGGYVSFPDDEEDSDIPKDSPLRISNRSVWERFLVVTAGVAANVIIAYLIVLLVAACSGGVPSGKYNVTVDSLEPDKTLTAAMTGIKPNDKIISANGVKIDSFSKFIDIAQLSKKFDGYASDKQIQNQLAELKKLNPDYESTSLIPNNVKIKLPKSSFEAPVTIPDDIFRNSTPKSMGETELTSDEKKLRDELNEKTFYQSKGRFTLEQIAIATADTVHPIVITVKRNGKNLVLAPAYPNKDGIIGVKLKVEEITQKVTGIASAFEKSWEYLHRNSYYMIKGLWLIITGKIPLSDVHGIIAVTKVGSDIIQHKGIWDGLLLTALISIDLAIVNMLPIPALDGGHVMFLLIEQLRGRPVEEKTQEIFAKYGFMFLIGLMFIIIFNDIMALVTDKL